MSKEYPYIRAWGRFMGSNSDYIQDQIAKAKSQGAPQTAIYEIYADDGSGPTGKWRTFEDITKVETKQAIAEDVKQFL